MKKTLLFLVITLIFNYSNAQKLVEKYNYASGKTTETGKVDKNGFPIGEWQYKLDNGALDYTINWEQNSIKKYFESGELKETGTFIPETGVSIGKWISYYKNGTIKTIKTYDANGVKNGEFKHYLKNGTLKTIETYNKGIKQEL